MHYSLLQRLNTKITPPVTAERSSPWGFSDLILLDVERMSEWETPSDSFHEYYSSLIKQNIHVFIALEWKRICRYRAVTDQINALQAKIRLSLNNEKFQLYFGTSCMLHFCPVGCFSVLRQHLLWRTNSAAYLFGVFQLLVFGAAGAAVLGVDHRLFQRVLNAAVHAAGFSLGFSELPDLLCSSSPSQSCGSHIQVLTVFQVIPELPV